MHHPFMHYFNVSSMKSRLMFEHQMLQRSPKETHECSWCLSPSLIWVYLLEFGKRTVDERWTAGTPHIQTALCVPRTVVSCICWKWAVGSGLFSAISAFFCICLRSVLNSEYGKCLLSVSRIGGNGGRTNPGDGRQWMRCVSLSLSESVCVCV